MKVVERIEKLRGLMKEKGIDAYIISDVDPHQSEYVSEHWKTRSWISGFTGSAGTVVITMKENGLWTDGRYHIQAENQLKGSGIKLFKQGLPGVPSYIEWLEKELGGNKCVGYNGKATSQYIASKIENTLSKAGIEINDEEDLISVIWNDRPELSFNTIINHDVKYSGKQVNDKLQLVRKKMKKSKADYYILGGLDNIAWLFNIRGTDVPNNPVVFSYGLISHEKAFLFINKDRLTEEAENNLLNNGVTIKYYAEISQELKEIDEKSNVFFDPNKINRFIYKSIPLKCNKIKGTSIVTNLKAIKNEIEIENLKQCQIRDGVAMVNFLYWIKNNIGKIDITEISATEKLEYFRSKEDNFKGPSFDTIAGYKDHAAMMHYKANEESQYQLEDRGMFLIDSGGQYLDGTTDITRTIVLGDISDEEKTDYTLVLKGHIALCRAIFLYGATGSNIDILARYPLWERGIDYKCGTGHGVGFFLNVHEGPQNISQAINKTKLEENMIITIEPGIYKEGKHGIRIENTVVVSKHNETEFGKFLKFDTISYCPIDLEGVDVDMLDSKDKEWLNRYHREVYDKLAPYLNDEVREWLKKETREI